MATTYTVKSRTVDGRRVYYVQEDRNPHITQHSGYYSKRSAAIRAMKRISWGESPEPGDIES